MGKWQLWPHLGDKGTDGGTHAASLVALMSRISRGRLVSAAASAAVTLAALWLALITAATATIILRA